MALKIGIVGLANVGKSTLFNALTKSSVLAANYPFATIEPNEAVAEIKDSRLDILKEIYNSEKIVYSTINFYDIAGLVKGAHKGEGLGNKFLGHIRQADAIALVTRAFQDENITHVSGNADPKGDLETIKTELILADMQTLENAVLRYEKELKQKKITPDILECAREAFKILNDGVLLSESQLDFSPIKELGLISAKKILYIFNVDDEGLTDTSLQNSLLETIGSKNAIFLNAALEAELTDLSDEEAKELLNSYGQSTSGLDKLKNLGFDILGLQTFLTAGQKEIRSWTIKKGATAPQAAGEIHSDIQKGFIKAEIMSFDDLNRLKSPDAVKSAGLLRLEGKDYIMQEGDIANFKFNI